MNDLDFEQAFCEGRLDPAVFNHEGHLRIAWIFLRKYKPEFAICYMVDRLQNYVREQGAEEKFNLTVTIAAMRAVHHFMQRENIPDFRNFIQSYPRLLTNFSSLMEAHYSVDIFNAKTAKQSWLEPDLLPFT